MGLVTHKHQPTPLNTPKSKNNFSKKQGKYVQPTTAKDKWNNLQQTKDLKLKDANTKVE